MKILQTNKAYAPHVGGIETTITNLSEGLVRKHGMDVEVLVCNNVRSFRTVRAQVSGVPVTYVPAWGSVASLPISPSYPLALSARAADILHVHEPFPLADASLLAFPSILERFGHVVVSWHGDVVRQKWALPFYRPMIHRVLRRAERILVSAESLIDASEFLPMYRQKCEVIPLGIKLDWMAGAAARRATVERIRHKKGNLLLLFVGRLVYYKGLRYLIEALSMTPGASLVILGSGPLRGRVMDDINEYRVGDRVEIIPYAPEQDLYAWYEACDLLVLPSTERSETFGLVQIEAMACGKPVVSTRIGTGVTFVNQDGVTGLTVPPRDAQALAAAIRILAENPGLRESLGKKGRERALAEFSAERMVDRTADVYRRLCAHGEHDVDQTGR